MRGPPSLGELQARKIERMNARICRVEGGSLADFDCAFIFDFYIYYISFFKCPFRHPQDHKLHKRNSVKTTGKDLFFWTFLPISTQGETWSCIRSPAAAAAAVREAAAAPIAPRSITRSLCAGELPGRSSRLDSDHRWPLVHERHYAVIHTCSDRSAHCH
jgi:hypothetical protein